jgi:hypothetical protein
MNVRPQYFSRMVYDKVTYVSATLCFLGLVFITWGRKMLPLIRCNILTVLMMDKFLQSVCDLSDVRNNTLGSIVA